MSVTTDTADSGPAEPPFSRLHRFMEVTGIQGNRIVGRVREPLADSIAGLRRLFADAGYTAYFERSGDEHVVVYGHVPRHPEPKVWVNVLLFVATVGTTLLVGALNRGGNPFQRPLDILLGLPFSVGIILVLGSHELAHYLTARKLGVEATLPYFLPVPHPMTGTMGAFIRITSPVPSKGALVRVGVAGPLVGFLVALPISVIGLALSRPVAVDTAQGIQLGSPLIFWLISELLHPNLGPGKDLLLHPLAFAGWLGLFVTALNLLPIGQLDGGHVAYAVFGRRWTRLSWIVIGLMVLLGFFWMGWPFWAVLSVLLGLRHPPPLDDITPLSRTERWLAVAALVLLVLTLTPAPFGAARF
jgi:membrane-associated protease RseP (regulator of RpoE activity)